ncbi:integral membrane protein S linking to the trans Golgi network-domain-containing protein [Hysterangium stoloniferum]|nr:integral membrane protein S linking to the trans Golgi network-domain-containing protein [Hysterangium stoloniferum]
MLPFKPRNSGWDPCLIISQIVTLQSVHYLTLCLLVPPLLSIFAEPNALAYEGGATTVGVIMDWREMSSLPIYHSLHGQDQRGLDATLGFHMDGKEVNVGFLPGQMVSSMWDSRIDPRRGWCIAFAWLAASIIDVYYLYIFVRRPRLILDFALTFMLNHLILTTYYSSAVPSSLFFWVMVISGTSLTTLLAEQLCVKREMQEGLSISSHSEETTDGNIRVGGLVVDSMELGQLRRD